MVPSLRNFGKFPSLHWLLKQLSFSDAFNTSSNFFFFCRYVGCSLNLNFIDVFNTEENFYSLFSSVSAPLLSIFHRHCGYFVAYFWSLLWLHHRLFPAAVVAAPSTICCQSKQLTLTDTTASSSTIFYRRIGSHFL